MDIKLSQNEIYNELITKQLKDVPANIKLSVSDIRRICKYINVSIFSDECSIWNGYITNENNMSKGTYINFFFKGKKVALHRLIYSNYVSVMNSNEYLKFKCDNRGICCNINHFEKYKYLRGDVYRKKKKKINKDSIETIDVLNSVNENGKYIINFN